MEEFMGKVQPEAAYFAPDAGVRTAFFVFDVQDPSDMPPLLEPFFTAYEANVQLTPVMNGDDLRAGLQRLAGERPSGAHGTQRVGTRRRRLPLWTRPGRADSGSRHARFARRKRA
jgi:hypothetical protein